MQFVRFLVVNIIRIENFYHLQDNQSTILLFILTFLRIANLFFRKLWPKNHNGLLKEVNIKRLPFIGLPYFKTS